MASPNIEYWEIVEYGVDDLGYECEMVVSSNLTELEAKRWVMEVMPPCDEYEGVFYPRDEYEGVFYMARKMS